MPEQDHKPLSIELSGAECALITAGLAVIRGECVSKLASAAITLADAISAAIPEDKTDDAEFFASATIPVTFTAQELAPVALGLRVLYYAHQSEALKALMLRIRAAIAEQYPEEAAQYEARKRATAAQNIATQARIDREGLVLN